MSALPYHYIAIEGNIGAGKTTLSKKLSLDFGCRLVLEQFTDNPFLPLFYEHPERYAFAVETFFLTERHKQLQESFPQHSLFPETVIADYFFTKTLLFARNNLNENEYKLFQRLYHPLNASCPKPDLLVYLHRPIETLLKNINTRSRQYETNISPNYLLQVQSAYLDFFKTNPPFPILIIDVNDKDFVNDQVMYHKITDLLKINRYSSFQRIILE
ncbi:MAG: deoxynucleoside kinase [Saprospiraceae bacterium]|nr:deoxynucleoside kinase [Saprospiraceae bacterium]